MDTSLVQQAIAAIKANDKATGRKLLLDFLRDNPEHENALLWLSVTTDDVAEQCFYFQQVLRINPDNSLAQKALKALGADLEAPPFDLMSSL
jgi:outer membrane protein assembly factor BamD (BamD/ComL family)